MKVVRFDGKLVGVFSDMAAVNQYWFTHFGYAFCHATGYSVVKN